MADSGGLSDGERAAKKTDSDGAKKEIKSDLKKRKADSCVEKGKDHKKTQTLNKKKKTMKKKMDSGVGGGLSRGEVERFDRLIEEEKKFISEPLRDRTRGVGYENTPESSGAEPEFGKADSYDQDKDSDDED